MHVLLARLIFVFFRYPTTALTLTFLAITSYYDVKYREISGKLFIAFTPASALALYFLFRFGFTNTSVFSINAVVTFIIAASTYLLARKGIIGFGDVLAVTAVGLLNPYVIKVGNLIVTPLMMSILLGSTYLIAYVTVNAIHNLRRINEFSNLTKGMGKLSKTYFFIVGKVMTTREFKEKKFYFPLVTASESRAFARVASEPLKGSEYEVSGEYVIASFGLPFVVLLLTGYALYITLLLLYPSLCM